MKETLKYSHWVQEARAKDLSSVLQSAYSEWGFAISRKGWAMLPLEAKLPPQVWTESGLKSQDWSETSSTVLSSIDFRSVKENSHPSEEGWTAETVDMWIFSLRLGIAFKMLDRIREHLSNRMSHGKKTIQHQAVMIQLAEFMATLSTTLLEIEEAEESTEIHGPALPWLQKQLTDEMEKVSRLMGGHGYLEETGSDTLKYQARLLHNLCEGEV